MKFILSSNREGRWYVKQIELEKPSIPIVFHDRREEAARLNLYDRRMQEYEQHLSQAPEFLIEGSVTGNIGDNIEGELRYQIFSKANGWAEVGKDQYSFYAAKKRIVFVPRSASTVEPDKKVSGSVSEALCVWDEIDNQMIDVDSFEHARKYLKDNYADADEGIHPDVTGFNVYQKVGEVRFEINEEKNTYKTVAIAGSNYSPNASKVEQEGRDYWKETMTEIRELVGESEEDEEWMYWSEVLSLSDKIIPRNEVLKQLQSEFTIKRK